jgi:hypothetical protein
MIEDEVQRERENNMLIAARSVGCIGLGSLDMDVRPQPVDLSSDVEAVPLPPRKRAPVPKKAPALRQRSALDVDVDDISVPQLPSPLSSAELDGDVGGRLASIDTVAIT